MKVYRSARARFTLIFAFAGFLLAVSWAVGSLALSPTDETMSLNEAKVTVVYETSASAADLVLPFYPNANVEDGFTYNVTAVNGKQVLFYGFAVLVSPDATAEVVNHYREQLPGHPEPQVVESESSETIVFAAGDEDEVRTVSVSATENGSRIELTRALGVDLPAKELRPRRQEHVI